MSRKMFTCLLFLYGLTDNICRVYNIEIIDIPNYSALIKNLE